MNSALVTIFDRNLAPRTISLDEFEKDTVYFGRDPQNDIVLTSHLVSAEHGRFVYKNDMWVMEDKAVYMGQGSTNGLIYNNTSVTSHAVVDGDFIRINDGVETITEGVLFVFSSVDSQNPWFSISLSDKTQWTIGRDEKNRYRTPACFCIEKPC